MSVEGGSLPEESQLSWLLASQQAPVTALFLPLSVSYHSCLTVLLSIPSLPLALFFILNPREKRALQPPCFRSPEPIAFIIPVPSRSFPWPSIPLLLQTPSLGRRQWFLPAARFSGRDAAMPRELKTWLFSMVYGSRSPVASQHSRYGE